MAALYNFLTCEILLFEIKEAIVQLTLSPTLEFLHRAGKHGHLKDEWHLQAVKEVCYVNRDNVFGE